MGNIVHLVESRGVPLELIIQVFEEHGYVIDWLDFYQSCVDKGWNIKTTINKIEYSLMDVKGKEYTNEVLNRLKYCINLT